MYGLASLGFITGSVVRYEVFFGRRQLPKREPSVCPRLSLHTCLNWFSFESLRDGNGISDFRNAMYKT